MLKSMSKRMWVIFALGALLVGGTLPSHAQEGAETELARKLLEVSGSADLGKQVMEQLIGQMRQMAPSEVPDDFWTKTIERYDTGELIEKIIPIYTANLTADEMKAAIEFYSSANGKAIIEKMPQIMTESMTAGQEWGMSIAGEVMQEIQTMVEEAPAPAAESADS